MAQAGRELREKMNGGVVGIVDDDEGDNSGGEGE